MKDKDGSVVVSLGNNNSDFAENFGASQPGKPEKLQLRTPIYKFRSELSKYLQDHPGEIKELLSSVDRSKNHLEIEALMVENGAAVDKIFGGSITGLEASLHNIKDENLVKVHRAQQLQFIKELEEGNLKIRVVDVEKGAKVREMSNVSVKGVDLSVYN